MKNIIQRLMIIMAFTAAASPIIATQEDSAPKAHEVESTLREKAADFGKAYIITLPIAWSFNFVPYLIEEVRCGRMLNTYHKLGVFAGIATWPCVAYAYYKIAGQSNGAV